MAVAAEARAVPPDTRGGTAPVPLATFAAGVAALSCVLGGTILVQVWFALAGGPLTEECKLSLINTATGKPGTGALGICHIVEAFGSPAQTLLLIVGIAVGVVAVVAGAVSFKRMPSKRMREQCIAGAVLGGQAVVLALFLLWFRSGELMIFVRQFLNFEQLEGYLGRYITIGAKNTLILAFVGEAGGIVIGLLFAVFGISKRRVVRAPATAYVNFFRGTPLVWQLLTGYFVLRLGFRVDIEPFQTAFLIFSLNTGAYAAEVFRAGIQSIERGQIEAARSLGMTYLQSMRYAIVPQAVRRVIPPLMNEFVILIKDTALVVVLGLALDQLDIFSLSRQGQAATANSTFFVAAAIGYLVITLPLIKIVGTVERRLRSGLTGIVGAGV
jgi:His/Glu/Gln/Arg/opine family amino acid ABC transporter permease subunit